MPFSPPDNPELGQCPECGEHGAQYLGKRTSRYHREGTTYTYRDEQYKCRACGHNFIQSLSRAVRDPYALAPMAEGREP
jgi:DNA-directed RNA polymerase subunit M/transcription elongation factor TFIIS